MGKGFNLGASGKIRIELMKLFLITLIGFAFGQGPQCGRQIYPMTPGLLSKVLSGEYKSEWDAPADTSDLEPVPDYDEVMIWDNRRRRDDSQEFNPYDGEVGNFEHPDFFEKISGGFGGDRTSEDEEEYTGSPIARIVGGAVAKPYSYPWMVRVRACSGYACTRMCGGTLVSDRAVVTASHCIPPYAQSGIITAGAHEYYNARAQNFTIQSIHQHPGWNKSTRINDIAVIILEEPVKFSNKIQPACLPNKNHCFAPGTACVATGWGYIREGGPRSSLLREVPVRIMDSEHCNSAEYYNGRIKDGMLCAGYNEGQRDACTGDSGGPLVCPLENGRWVLAGATSWGVGCARYQRPGVYSNVAEFSDWIGSIINQYPDVVGNCKVNGNGYGYGGDWSWTGQMPAKKPQSQLFFSTGQSFGSEQPAQQAQAAPSKPVVVVKPTEAPKPFFPGGTPAAVDPFAAAAASEGEKGANPCNGLSGKALKKCKKKSGGSKKKKEKKQKAPKPPKPTKVKKVKNKKNKNKTFDFDELEGMSKKEKKEYKKSQKNKLNELEEVRGDDYSTFDSVDDSDEDNTMFGGWDYV